MATPIAEFDYYGEYVAVYLVEWAGGLLTLPMESGTGTASVILFPQSQALTNQQDLDDETSSLTNALRNEDGEWSYNTSARDAGIYKLLLMETAEAPSAPVLPAGMTFVPPPVSTHYDAPGSYALFLVNWEGGDAGGALAAAQTVEAADLGADYIAIMTELEANVLGEPQPFTLSDWPNFSGTGYIVDEGTGWEDQSTAAPRTLPAGQYFIATEVDSASEQYFTPTLPAGMTFVTEVEGWTELDVDWKPTLSEGWSYGPVILSPGYELPELPSDIGQAGLAEVAVWGGGTYPDGVHAWDDGTTPAYWNGTEWSGEVPADYTPVYLYVLNYSDEAFDGATTGSTLAAMLAFGSPESVETPAQKASKLRKVGFNVRGAEVLLAALEPAPEPFLIEGGEWPGATFLRLGTWQGGTLPAAPASTGTDIDPAYYACPPGSDIENLGTGYAISGQAAPAGWELYSIMWAAGYAVEASTPTTVVPTGTTPLGPDWKAILRRGDLSVRQMRTLRRAAERTAPVELVGDDYSYVVQRVRVTEPTNTTGQDWVLLPDVTMDFDTVDLTNQIGNVATPPGVYLLSFYSDGTEGNTWTTSDMYLLDGMTDQLNALTMKTLLRGGFTRHQARLILQEL